MSEYSSHNPQRYSHDGRTLTLREWSQVTGISIFNLRNRVKYGMSIGEAIAHPKHARRTSAQAVTETDKVDDVFSAWVKSGVGSST